ncbi:MAG: HAD-IA family hydrolase [Synechococcaceae cyanobacterium SM2_3_1]|nr:HAD-IA family hydrolase [Synechococcaceae cyanobacterium SM2_3_1]
MAQIQVIFFDAVGTLFSVQGSVGQIYSQAAAAYGVQESAAQVDRAFYKAFQLAPPAAFPGVNSVILPDLERQWWQRVVEQTFQELGYGEANPFPDFPTFFDQVFSLFETADPWELHEETIGVLTSLKNCGIQMGVISNFDSRLYPVLRSLGLDSFFSSVTISTHVGAAKPDPQVFHQALQQHQIAADQALHVGDSRSQDYQGAKQAGLQALWLDRLQKDPAATPEHERIVDLQGILNWLEL